MGGAGLASVELFNPANNTIQELGPGRFPAAYRFSAAALLTDGDVVVTGGYADGNQNAVGVRRFTQP